MQSTHHSQNDRTLRVSQLSTAGHEPRWVIAVFAHNEARNIRAALDSIRPAASDHEVAVYVLANGCTDATVDEVRSAAASLPCLWLVEMQMADKANAWNTFIHDLFSNEQADEFEAWFFMDGDVTVTSGSMPLLLSSLDDDANADAAGGMPGSGRDRDAWRDRMVRNGMLAGNFYALRGSFVRQLREFQMRMPVGLIGEDFLVSWLVFKNVWQGPGRKRGAHSVFNARAEFLFRSLSPWRPGDYRTYLHRMWRYTLRGIQHQMLIMLLMDEGFSSMPSSVEDLYRRGPLLSRLKWMGLSQTVLRLLAMQKIRSFRRAEVEQE